MQTKDETTQVLADAHFRIDPSITRIFRILEANEADATRPVKLLEVNEATIEDGIVPLGFRADAKRGVFHPSVIIEISPRELEQLCRGELQLPHDWQLGPELPRPAPAARAAS